MNPQLVTLPLEALNGLLAIANASTLPHSQVAPILAQVHQTAKLVEPPAPTTEPEKEPANA